MIANFHTHTVFCDGENTPEEVVLSAIEKGFSAIGFSGHGYTGFDLTYCMRDSDSYRAEIRRLREKYRARIAVYLGVEEDAFAPVDRSRYDYIIGSSHYLQVGGRYYPVDSGPESLRRCLDAFGQDGLRLAEAYYHAFCDYIAWRKPDIIGHFDLITKYDEVDGPRFLNNGEYERLAQAYIARAAQSGCLFEVNTGAVARGVRTTAYPSETLLHVLKKLDAGLILSSDSHAADTLDFGFEQTKAYLRDIGFTRLFTLRDGTFVPYRL